jgi:hypothetical protein
MVKKQKVSTKKRRQSNHPNLDPGLNLRSRWEEVYDVASYANKLPADAKDWLNKFMGEYVNANLDVENLENNLHNTKELKKSCQDRNNARNRDIYSRANASGNLIGLDELKKEYLEQESGLDKLDNFDDSNSGSDHDTDPAEDL